MFILNRNRIYSYYQKRWFR